GTAVASLVGSSRAGVGGVVEKARRPPGCLCVLCPLGEKGAARRDQHIYALSNEIVGMGAQLLGIIVRIIRDGRTNTEPTLAIGIARILQAENERINLRLLDRNNTRTAVYDSNRWHRDAPSLAWMR